MAVPAFVGAGSGVTITTGTATVSKTGCTAGNIIILSLLEHGQAVDFSKAARVNVQNLAGTTGTEDNIVSGSGVGLGLGEQTIWIARATANGTCSWDLTVGASGNDIYCRIYEFSGVSTGITIGSVIETQLDGPERADGTVTEPSELITTGSNRLAIVFVGIVTSQACADYTGETGGDLARPVTEYQGTGAGGTLCIQTATAPLPTTIKDGSFAISSAGWGIYTFAFLPTAGTSVASVAWAGP